MDRWRLECFRGVNDFAAYAYAGIDIAGIDSTGRDPSGRDPSGRADDGRARAGSWARCCCRRAHWARDAGNGLKFSYAETQRKRRVHNLITRSVSGVPVGHVLR